MKIFISLSFLYFFCIFYSCTTQKKTNLQSRNNIERVIETELGDNVTYQPNPTSEYMLCYSYKYVDDLPILRYIVYDTKTNELINDSKNERLRRVEWYSKTEIKAYYMLGIPAKEQKSYILDCKTNKK